MFSSTHDGAGVPMVMSEPTIEAKKVRYAFAKRAFDIVCAVLLLALFAPVVALLALIVKLTSKGPAFYRSTRVGLGGRHFQFLKLRSMYVDADARQAALQEDNEKDGPIFKMRNDPRVTPVGRFIRKYSLDELPQLLHVLRGEMSMVGPRPPVPREVVHYDDLAMERLCVKPGISCYWQVMGRSDLSFEEWMALDRKYVEEMSFWTDVMILLKTPAAVFRATGHTERVRLAILTEFFHPDSGSGTGKVVSGIARKLHDAHGFEIDVFCSANRYREDSPAAPLASDWDGIKIRRLASPDLNRKGTPLRFTGNWMLMRAVRRALFGKRPCYDAVLVTTAPPVLPHAALHYRRRRGVPYAYVVYDLEPDRTTALGITPPRGLPSRSLRALQSSWLKGASRVVAIGRDMEARLVERYGLAPERVSLLEVGYPGPSVRAQHGGAEFRAQHGLEGFLVVYSGNFARYHEFDTVLDAAAKSQATFLLIGGGHKEAYLKEEIARRGLKNVRMMSFVPHGEYEGMLQASDLSLVSLVPGVEGTCVPSKFYSLLANGRPTLAIMASGTEVARTIEENGCGLVVAPGDVDGLVAAIETLRKDPRRLEAMGTAAAGAFDAKYDEDRLVARWAAMLKQMAQERR